MKNLRTAVYRTQVITFRRALRLLGIPVPAPDRGVATSGDHILATFRALPNRRDTRGQALRNAVALSLRVERALRVPA